MVGWLQPCLVSTCVSSLRAVYRAVTADGSVFLSCHVRCLALCPCAALPWSCFVGRSLWVRRPSSVQLKNELCIHAMGSGVSAQMVGRAGRGRAGSLRSRRPHGPRPPAGPSHAHQSPQTHATLVSLVSHSVTQVPHHATPVESHRGTRPTTCTCTWRGPWRHEIRTVRGTRV